MTEQTGIITTEKSSDILKLAFHEEIRTPLQIKNEQPCFVIQKLDTTPIYDPNIPDWIDQHIICIPDALGINGETLIGQRRTERPRSQSQYIPVTGFDRNTIKTLFPILIKPENIWLVSTIIEDINDTETLDWLYDELNEITHVHNANDLTKKTLVENANELKKKILLNPAVPKDILSKDCIFCNVNGHKMLESLGVPDGAFCINNDFPFGPILHKVLILQTDDHDIAEITSEHVSKFYDLFYKIAEKAPSQVDGLTYGMNYGLPRLFKNRQVLASGASQLHIHAQVTGIGVASFNAGDRIGYICKSYKHQYPGRDYLTDYVTALRQANLIIAENEHAILYVPIAQRFNHELQIITTDHRIGNILQTTPEIRRSIAELEYMAYLIYQQDELNCQSFNTVLYSTRLSERSNHGQRLICNYSDPSAKNPESCLKKLYINPNEIK